MQKNLISKEKLNGFSLKYEKIIGDIDLGNEIYTDPKIPEILTI